MEIATGRGDIVTRAIALFYATGTDRFLAPTMRPRKGSNPIAFEAMLQTGYPHCVLELAERGSVRMREPLPIFVALLSRDVPARSTGFEPKDCDDYIPPTNMIGEVPSWAIDFYTRPGRAALKAFLKRDTATARWVVNHVERRHRVEFLGGLVFRVEGGLLRRRLQWPIGRLLRTVMEKEAVGGNILDASEPLSLLRDELPALDIDRRLCLEQGGEA